MKSLPVRLPEYISSEDPVELRLWRRLPLDHDGLVCPPTGYDILRRSAGCLLPEHQSNRHTEGKKQEQKRERQTVMLYFIGHPVMRISALLMSWCSISSYHLLSNISINMDSLMCRSSVFSEWAKKELNSKSLSQVTLSLSLVEPDKRDGAATLKEPQLKQLWWILPGFRASLSPPLFWRIMHSCLTRALHLWLYRSFVSTKPPPLLLLLQHLAHHFHCTGELLRGTTELTPGV